MYTRRHFAIINGNDLTLIEAANKEVAKTIAENNFDHSKEIILREFIGLKDQRQKPQTYYAATGNKFPWDGNEQVKLYNMTLTEAVRHCKGMSQATKLEIRLSTTEGFNNQGTYIWWHR